MAALLHDYNYIIRSAFLIWATQRVRSHDEGNDPDRFLFSASKLHFLFEFCKGGLRLSVRPSASFTSETPLLISIKCGMEGLY